VDEDLVVRGKLLTPSAAKRVAEPAPQYCWAARWARDIERRTAEAKERLRAIAVPPDAPGEHGVRLDSEPVLAFNDYLIHEYRPPEDKRLLVFLQCSVRRPFSSSPSHASMRRAISVASGYSPSDDFIRCPVHVVVLASRIGPVPYELEDVYPANVGGGGVKHFDPAHYAHAKPVLAERMASYITAHRDAYDRITTFTEGRYGEVMNEARRIAGVDFPVLPMPDGARLVRAGRSRPRTYWGKYWIQLYAEVTSWLDPPGQAAARARLDELDVELHAGTP
jgi:hypothetical protein